MPREPKPPRIVHRDGRVIRIFDVPARATQIMGTRRPKPGDEDDDGYVEEDQP